MPACSHCNVEVAPNAVWYTAGGAVACTPCYHASLAREAEARKRDAASDYGVPGLRPDSPARMMLKGGALFGLSVAALAAGLALRDRLYIYPFFLMLPGFAMFARGLHLWRAR